MSIEIRACRDDAEIRQYQELGAYVFADASLLEPDAAYTLPEWTTCAFDDGRIVATLGAFPFTVRLNGAPVPMGGVTMVGTQPGYRRQGLVRQLMTTAMAQMRDRGQAYAILWASMGAIYQRFGYGLAASYVRYSFDPRNAAFQEPQPTPGRVTLHTPEEAYAEIRALYIEYATPRNLMIHRSSALWKASTLRPAKKGEPVYVGVYRDAQGAPRGHVVYQTKERTDAPHDSPGQTMTVNDFIALDLEAHRALWEYLRRHDLVGRIELDGCVPEDDPAPLVLLEPRVLNRTVSDAIWMRVVDVERALATRRFSTPGRLVIAVEDDRDCPWNNGAYLVETEGGEASVSRTQREPEIVTGPNGLASLISGYASATRLERAGRLSSANARALRTADALLATDYAPFCPNSF